MKKKVIKKNSNKQQIKKTEIKKSQIKKSKIKKSQIKKSKIKKTEIKKPQIKKSQIKKPQIKKSKIKKSQIKKPQINKSKIKKTEIKKTKNKYDGGDAGGDLIDGIKGTINGAINLTKSLFTEINAVFNIGKDFSNALNPSITNNQTTPLSSVQNDKPLPQIPNIT